jgi:hypothetical protein
MGDRENLETDSELLGQCRVFDVLHSGKNLVTCVGPNGKVVDLNIGPENARATLAIIKEWEDAVGERSYSLRREVVKRSGGLLQTFEAFTVQLLEVNHPDLRKVLEDPSVWIPERAALHERVIGEELRKCIALSASLNDPQPTIYGLRGNTAAGKTTALKQNPRFHNMIGLNGELIGAINPDTYKFALRIEDSRDGIFFTNSSQVHVEGAMLAKKIADLAHELQSSIIIDKRMSTVDEVEELLSSAERRGKRVELLDIDASLELTLVRVLCRKIIGIDPVMPFNPLVSGFEDIRKNRLSLILSACLRGSINTYTLFSSTPKGTADVVGKKVGGKFKVEDGAHELFVNLIDGDLEEEVKGTSAQIINDRFIHGQVAATSELYKGRVQQSLQKYHGKTLEEALRIRTVLLGED